MPGRSRFGPSIGEVKFCTKCGTDQDSDQVWDRLRFGPSVGQIKIQTKCGTDQDSDQVLDRSRFRPSVGSIGQIMLVHRFDK